MTSAPTNNAQTSRRTAPTGWSLVEGRAEPQAQVPAFRAIAPGTGRETRFEYHAATPEQVDQACRAAWVALHEMRRRPPEHRAGLLEAIAANILDLGQPLIQLCAEETGLPDQRLLAERERTTGTLLRFAETIREGSWVRAIIDRADPARQPRPKPDIRRVLRPVGPVAVFGASNFPLAYSTMGTDAASALAAGCPVVIKGHPLHPGTGEMVGWAVADALRATGFPAGAFAFLHAGGQREKSIGEELIKHPFIRAGGFTGSQAGGVALADIARSRPDPIPFYAEMGSTNPVFILPEAARTQADTIAQLLTEAITAFSGQQCTCPGLIFLVDGPDTRNLLAAMAKRFNTAPEQTMLAARIRDAFTRRLNAWSSLDGVEIASDINRIKPSKSLSKNGTAGPGPISAPPALLRTTSAVFLGRDELHGEIFGPAALVVLCPEEKSMAHCAAAIQGTLTASIFLGGDDRTLAKRLLSVLEHRAGRIIFNGVPTGVEVCEAMVHGGPYPATNRPDTTAVGPLALERWCRPVSYQNGMGALLPPELRDDNPGSIRRRVDGKWRTGAIDEDE